MSYERRDASPAIIGVSAGILLFLLAASILLAAWFFRAQVGSTRGFPADGRQSSFTRGPEQEPDVLKSWRSLQAEAAGLARYGWIDRQAGLARIPIERAMELAAAGAQPAPFPPAPSAVRHAEAVPSRTPTPPQ